MNGLLADSDLIQFIAMVVVLALVGVSTWIRKTIEKMQQREGGKPIDVGRAVRQQLDKYMRASGELPAERPAPPVAQPPAEPVRARPVAEPRPAVVVAKEPRRRRAAPAKKRAVRTRRSLHLGARDVKRAVVTAELLGPPLALRKDYRLF